MSPIDDKNCRPIVNDDNPLSETWQIALTCFSLIATYCFYHLFTTWGHDCSSDINGIQFETRDRIPYKNQTFNSYLFH